MITVLKRGNKFPILALAVLAFVVWTLNRDIRIQDSPKQISETKTSTTPNQHAVVEKLIPQAKVSTVGWSLCRNEKYGYEFKFPGEWRIYSGQTYGADVPTGDIEVQSCSAENVVEQIIVQPADRNQVPFPRMGVYFVDTSIYDSGKLTKEAIFRRVLENREGRPYTYYVVGSEEALFFDDTPYLSSPSRFVVLVHKGEEIRIVMDNISTDEVDSILSTFKFLGKQ